MNSTSCYCWKETGLFQVKMAGAFHYRDQIASIARNDAQSNAFVYCSAALIQEEDNKHDENATAVKINDLIIGHLPRDFAEKLRTKLRGAGLEKVVTYCKAIISSGITTLDRQYDYVVELDIDTSEAPELSKLDPSLIVRHESSFSIRKEREGAYQVSAWLPEGCLGDMKKNRAIHAWTTDYWDSINYYAKNRPGIGLGHKLFSIKKDQHHEMFGTSPVSATFVSIDGRNAVIELKVAT